MADTKAANPTTDDEAMAHLVAARQAYADLLAQHPHVGEYLNTISQIFSAIAQATIARQSVQQAGPR